MSDTIVIPAGYKADARNAIFIVAVLGEVLQGGLFFGWNALSIMIKDLGNFSEGCSTTQGDTTALPPTASDSYATATSDQICKSQESMLALIWTVGIFALNCGPVLMGFVLDYLGPKFTAILGVCLNMLGLILFGVSSTSGTNAFIAAAIILGLGNITFHLAQFHISALYPRKRGLVSSVFVAGFTGSGIIMYILLLIFQDAGYTTGAYKGTLIGYSGICALWIPLLAWMMPNDSFRVGTMYLLRDDWRFEIRQRSDMDRQYRRATTLQDYVAAASQAGARAGGDEVAGVNGPSSPSNEYTHTGLMSGNVPDSSDPVWNGGGGGLDAAEMERRQRQMEQQKQWGGGFVDRAMGSAGQTPLSHEHQQQHINSSNTTTNYYYNNTAAAAGDAPMAMHGNNANSYQYTSNAASAHTSSSNIMSGRTPTADGMDGATLGPESMPLPPDVVWGPLVFEARRFVELRKKTFKEQFLSTESFGMGVFYTLNVFFLQFYLGTQRLQLDYKGDYNNAYSNFGNVVVAFAFVTIPIIGWLLDKKGYGITMGTINALAVLTSLLQALPVLWLQAITLVVWMVARFFMYSSYFAIFGGLFGFRNFGKLVAIDNTFNGLFGLLQYPLTYLAIHSFDGNFTAINVAQVIVLLPLFIFCYFMGKWEREDLVPIRPLEGEELPCDMMGARTRKHLPSVHLPHIELPTVHLPRVGRSGSSQ